MRLTVSVQASCALHEDYQVQTLNDLKQAPTRPIDSVFGPGTKKLIDELLIRGWINENVYDKTISKSYAVQIKGKV
jgi:chromosome segregation and condensation protein ScpB